MAIQILMEPARTPYDLRFKLLGTPVRVHPLFWLMGLLIVYSAARKDPLYMLLGIACLFVSILVHEFGHALSSQHFGDRHCYVILYVMGGLCCSGDRPVPPRMPRIWMLLWGPLAGFILGGIAYAVSLAVDRGMIPGSYPLDFALAILIFVNVAWGVMNLLPVFPLDGGQIAREILVWKWPDSGEVSTFTVSIVTAILVAIAATVYSIYQYAVYKSSPELLPIIFFGMLAYQNWRFRKQVIQMREYGGYEEEAPRAAWEQDPDWWKKS
jgi:stage IV sporulation protein FB